MGCVASDQRRFWRKNKKKLTTLLQRRAQRVLSYNNRLLVCIYVDGHYYTAHSVTSEKHFMQKYTTVTASNPRRQARDGRCGRMCVLSKSAPLPAAQETEVNASYLHQHKSRRTQHTHPTPKRKTSISPRRQQQKVCRQYSEFQGDCVPKITQRNKNHPSTSNVESPQHHVRMCVRGCVRAYVEILFNTWTVPSTLEGSNDITQNNSNIAGNVQQKEKKQSTQTSTWYYYTET